MKQLRSKMIFLSLSLIAYFLSSCGNGSGNSQQPTPENLSLDPGLYQYVESIYTMSNGQCIQSVRESKDIRIAYKGQCFELGSKLNSCNINLKANPCLKGDMDSDTQVLYTECTANYLNFKNYFHAKITTTNNKAETCTDGVISIQSVGP